MFYIFSPQEFLQKKAFVEKLLKKLRTKAQEEERENKQRMVFQSNQMNSSKEKVQIKTYQLCFIDELCVMRLFFKFALHDVVIGYLNSNIINALSKELMLNPQNKQDIYQFLQAIVMDTPGINSCSGAKNLEGNIEYDIFKENQFAQLFSTLKSKNEEQLIDQFFSNKILRIAFAQVNQSLRESNPLQIKEQRQNALNHLERVFNLYAN